MAVPVPMPSCFAMARQRTFDMACAELERLKGEHDQALQVWASFRPRETVEIPGRQHDRQQMLEAFDELHRIADLLYRHRRSCPRCKKGEGQTS